MLRENLKWLAFFISFKSTINAKTDFRQLEDNETP